MTKEDKQIINRATKESWRIGDRTRLKRLLEKNLKLYRENVKLEEENNKLLDIINNQDVKVVDLEQQIEKMKADVKQGQSYWNSGEMQYDLYQRLLDKWEIKENG